MYKTNGYVARIMVDTARFTFGKSGSDHKKERKIAKGADTARPVKYAFFSNFLVLSLRCTFLRNLALSWSMNRQPLLFNDSALSFIKEEPPSIGIPEADLRIRSSFPTCWFRGSEFKPSNRVRTDAFDSGSLGWKNLVRTPFDANRIPTNHAIV